MCFPPLLDDSTQRDRIWSGESWTCDGLTLTHSASSPVTWPCNRDVVHHCGMHGADVNQWRCHPPIWLKFYWICLRDCVSVCTCGKYGGTWWAHMLCPCSMFVLSVLRISVENGSLYKFLSERAKAPVVAVGTTFHTSLKLPLKSWKTKTLECHGRAVPWLGV